MATEQRLDLIDRNTLLRDKAWLCGGFVGDLFSMGYMEALDKVETVIRNAPTIEARPVVHGEWMPASNKPGVNVGKKCSLCGARITNREYYNGNHLFCHKCGNHMDGGADNG